MKICAVQLRAAPGDVASNLDRHLHLLDLAQSVGAGLVFFPELSLTGYEPGLAASLGMHASDPRLDVLQTRCDASQVVIGVGLPLKMAPNDDAVQIGMVWFAPGLPRRTYAKQGLHTSERPYFVPGETPMILELAGRKLAPAICYESLQPGHADDAAQRGASVYLASVAKPAHGLAKAMQHYPEVARGHRMCVLMAGSVGACDDFVSVGRSAAWNERGEMLAQMDGESDGMVLLDLHTGQAAVHTLA